MIMQKSDHPNLYVISGPSGSGKTTICRNIAGERGWYYSVSHTTRSKRENETHGKDYFFVSRKCFEVMKRHDEFLEWAKVYDHLYGTSKKMIQEKLHNGQSVILDLDTQGAANIKKAFPKSVLIFIETPDFFALKQRLNKRGSDSVKEIEKRLKQAEAEIKEKNRYDFIVVNDDLDEAVIQINRIIDKINSSAAEFGDNKL